MDLADDDERSASVARVEWNGADARRDGDRVVREEPLEIRVNGVALAVVMRTPGHDEELVRGFLVTERVVEHPDAVASVRHCSDDSEGNVVQVVLREPATLDLARLRRNLYASSSCGLCGKATIAAALAHAPPLDAATTISAAVLYRLPAQLAAHQDVFHDTGGLHAAGLFTRDGALRVVREDVGRHNAVDKVIGWAIERGGADVLLVSGRVSYEIVQKALAARVPVVAAVSAPSSLAIELAAASNLTLIGFLRGARMCVYSAAERVTA